MSTRTSLLLTMVDICMVLLSLDGYIDIDIVDEALQMLFGAHTVMKILMMD